MQNNFNYFYDMNNIAARIHIEKGEYDLGLQCLIDNLDYYKECPSLQYLDRAIVNMTMQLIVKCSDYICSSAQHEFYVSTLAIIGEKFKTEMDYSLAIKCFEVAEDISTQCKRNDIKKFSSEIEQCRMMLQKEDVKQPAEIEEQKYSWMNFMQEIAKHSGRGI